MLCKTRSEGEKEVVRGPPYVHQRINAKFFLCVLTRIGTRTVAGGAVNLPEVAQAW